jgi:hypothetical protein
VKKKQSKENQNWIKIALFHIKDVLRPCIYQFQSKKDYLVILNAKIKKRKVFASLH